MCVHIDIYLEKGDSKPVGMKEGFMTTGPFELAFEKDLGCVEIRRKGRLGREKSMGMYNRKQGTIVGIPEACHRREEVENKAGKKV